MVEARTMEVVRLRPFFRRNPLDLDLDVFFARNGPAANGARSAHAGPSSTCLQSPSVRSQPVNRPQAIGQHSHSAQVMV